MEVYVSEITMPKGEGSKLVLQIFPNGEVYDGHGIRLGITKWAEAVPVPPHGRCIDADALLRVIHDAYEVRDAEQNAIMDKVSMLVIAAPTIIPASEEAKE